mmetsp:Transcript_10966/g.16116  ORF Transcript_10966/g.16116 Transcript_10966/m.16116 type:complete len:339 (+) Transcript_10966:47-1063(+)
MKTTDLVLPNVDSSLVERFLRLQGTRTDNRFLRSLLDCFEDHHPQVLSYNTLPFDCIINILSFLDYITFPLLCNTFDLQWNYIKQRATFTYLDPHHYKKEFGLIHRHFVFETGIHPHILPLLLRFAKGKPLYLHYYVYHRRFCIQFLSQIVYVLSSSHAMFPSSLSFYDSFSDSDDLRQTESDTSSNFFNQHSLDPVEILKNSTLRLSLYFSDKQLLVSHLEKLIPYRNIIYNIHLSAPSLLMHWKFEFCPLMSRIAPSVINIVSFKVEDSTTFPKLKCLANHLPSLKSLTLVSDFIFTSSNFSIICSYFSNLDRLTINSKSINLKKFKGVIKIEEKN